MVDVFYDGANLLHLREKKIETKHTHGTGCTYAAAIAAWLARGLEPRAAVTHAKHFITAAIAHGICVGQGYGPTDPMGSLHREVASGRLLSQLREGSALLKDVHGIAPLLAAGLSNLFYCLDDPQSTADIAAFPAPFVRRGNRMETVGEPRLDSGSYPAPLLLAAHRADKKIRAMLTLRYDEGIVTAAKSRGFAIAPYTGQDFPAAAPMPDCLCDSGNDTRPPLIILFAPTPNDVADKAASLARCFRGC